MTATQRWISGEDLLSDESDYIGDHRQRRKLDSHSEDVHSLAQQWLEHQDFNARAAQDVPEKHVTSSPKSRQTSHEIDESDSYNRRVQSETVDEFLRRLPPIECPNVGPWIWIHNLDMHHARKSAQESDETSSSGGLEQCQTLMEGYRVKEASIYSEMKGKAQASITRKLTPLRTKLREDILKNAKETHVVCGKWMLFPSDERLARTWRLVAQGVADGRLGPIAKVATEPGRSGRLICVYTVDFSDLGDVKRALNELVKLGLCPAEGMGIYYKPDVFTYLGLESGNTYGLRASLYSSRDLLGDGESTN